MNQSLQLSKRIISIDALRGFVMLIMIIDHVREYFYLHLQISDPMDVVNTDPLLFFSRFFCHVCAPVFVFLCGLSAHLYGQKYNYDKRIISRFLLTRGIFLVLLEITVVNFCWTFALPPTIIYLQIIWAIGMSMILLSGIIWLPYRVIGAIGLIIIFGHNLLTSIDFSSESPWYVPWAMIHDRSVVVLSDSLRFRTSYQILPWVGIMALGYVFGRCYKPDFSSLKRGKVLLYSGITMLALFIVLRAFNIYGEADHWYAADSIVRSLMSFINVTKYPASLQFVLITLGMGAIILYFFERKEISHCPVWLRKLTVFGKAPLFFYVVHLYIIHLIYMGALLIFGPNHGERFVFNHISYNWLLAAILIPVHYYLCVKFLAFKKRHNYRWLSYF